MLCEKCGAEVSEAETFCPQCGAIIDIDALSGGIDELKDLDAEFYTLLAEANLCRLKHQWHEATGKCIRLLRRYPNNPLAQSLLASIYEDQGNLEDALDMYKVALDLNPRSRKDQAKVQELTQRLETQKAKAEAPPSAVLSKRAILLLSAIIGLMGMGFLALWLFWLKPLHAPLEPTLFYPTITSRPKPAPPPTEVVRQPYSGVVDRERHLLNVLSSPEYAIGKPDVGVNSLQIDPATQTAYISFEAAPQSELAALKQAIITDCFKLVATAIKADPNLTEFAIQAKAVFLDPQGLAVKDIAFSGQITKNAYLQYKDAIPTITFQDSPALFKNLWWHPYLE